MSNEELAVLIQAGDRERILELWENIHLFIWQQANKRAYTLDGRGGVTAEDLYQAGFFALLAAADGFDPSKGMTFISWLAMYLKAAFADAAGYRTQKARADPLQQATSLDAPLGDDSDEITLADCIPDPTADAAFDAVAEQDRMQRLRLALETAMKSLSQDEQDVLPARYYRRRTIDEIAADRGTDQKHIRQIAAKALRNLRHPKNSRELLRYW